MWVSIMEKTSLRMSHDWWIKSIFWFLKFLISCIKKEFSKLQKWMIDRKFSSFIWYIDYNWTASNIYQGTLERVHLIMVMWDRGNQNQCYYVIDLLENSWALEKTNNIFISDGTFLFILSKLYPSSLLFCICSLLLKLYRYCVKLYILREGECCINAYTEKSWGWRSAVKLIHHGNPSRVGHDWTSLSFSAFMHWKS